MSTGSWLNTDGLLLQYGTQKANPEAGGDYVFFGPTRVMEVEIDCKSLTTSPQVQSLTTFFPAGYNVFIESVDLVTLIGATGGTSLSLGLGYFSGSTYGTITTNTETSTSSATGITAYSALLPGVTAVSNTALLAAVPIADYATAGMKFTVNQTTNASYVGAYVGAQSTATTHSNYITALISGTHTAGLLRARVFYRGYGTIFN